MNRDDIIRMATDAGLIRSGDGWTMPSHWGLTEVERFANLVYEQVFKDANYAATRTVTDAAIALERGACAQVCDEIYRAGRKHGAKDCADAIRARGQQ